jgi:hypothetical protein
MHAQARPDHERIASRTQQSACLVIGTNIDASHVREAAVIRAYNAPAQAEGGFRVLKDPWCLVSSLLVTKPCRIPGRLMVMT